MCIVSYYKHNKHMVMFDGRKCEYNLKCNGIWGWFWPRLSKTNGIQPDVRLSPGVGKDMLRVPKTKK